VGAALGAGGAAGAPVAETARSTPVTSIVGTWAWRDLDEALATSDAPITVRIAASGGRPVLVFPGQAPVKGRWTPRTHILRVTVPRPLIGTTQVVPVLYVLKAGVSKGRMRAEGVIKIRAAGYSGLSTVLAVRTAAPS
jgi:hypothetical protein